MENGKLDIRKFDNGTYSFDYKLDAAFFSRIQSDVESLDESQLVSDADVAAHAILTVTPQFVNLHYSTSGSVDVPCDRCLAPVKVNIEAQDDEPVETDEVDVEWLLYEQVMLSIPVAHVHQEGLCDPQMEQLLNKIIKE